VAEIKIDTPEGIVLQLDVAGPGTRTLAALFDLAVFAFLMLVAVTSLAIGFGGSSAMVLLAGGILLLIGYQVFFAALWNGATPGKRLLGVRVVDQRGYPATLAQHFLRALFYPLDILPPLFPGLLTAVFTERHQRLGDLVAGTLVLRPTDERAAVDPFARARWSELPHPSYELTPALAERFNRSDLDFLRELLGRTGLDAAARGRLLRRTAALYLARLARPVPERMERREVEKFLRELYLFLRQMRGRLGVEQRRS